MFYFRSSSITFDLESERSYLKKKKKVSTTFCKLFLHLTNLGSSQKGKIIEILPDTIHLYLDKDPSF